MTKVAVIGTVGVPARYGGFETLAENLTRHFSEKEDLSLEVFCSAKEYPEKLKHWNNAKLNYVNISANGFRSIFYDGISMLLATKENCSILLLLGVSGAIFIPAIRIITRSKIIVNVDGIEWRREKWSPLARFFLKFSELISVRFSHAVIADNLEVQRYLREEYNVESELIAYGGDNAMEIYHGPCSSRVFSLGQGYALALCRIEPENNIELILKSFESKRSKTLVFVGNWRSSKYGRNLLAKYAGVKNIKILDAIYDPVDLFSLRKNAGIYIHGHSAGGTNPSLVEMMHFGTPVAAFDCAFNRMSTLDKANYFSCSAELSEIIEDSLSNGEAMREIARSNYMWEGIGNSYYKLLKKFAD